MIDNGVVRRRRSCMLQDPEPGGGVILDRLPHHLQPGEREADVRPVSIPRNNYRQVRHQQDALIPATVGGPPLLKEDGPKTPDKMDKMQGILYRKAMGAIIWISTLSRSGVRVLPDGNNSAYINCTASKR